MAKIYARKILSGAVNPATGELWKPEDVPEKWRGEVRRLLEENS